MPVDIATAELIRTCHPSVHEANARREAQELELRARTRDLMLYEATLSERPSRKVLQLHFREPHHLWMLARALASDRRLGLLLADKGREAAEDGRGFVCTVLRDQWGFKECSLDEWCGKVAWRVYRDGWAPVKLEIGPSFRLADHTSPRTEPISRELAGRLMGSRRAAQATCKPLVVGRAVIDKQADSYRAASPIMSVHTP